MACFLFPLGVWDSRNVLYFFKWIVFFASSESFVATETAATLSNHLSEKKTTFGGWLFACVVDAKLSIHLNLVGEQ